ncbi:hypothetical protein GCM10010978_09890 [Compostibacillus humi]|uniref:Uncharacterized protein n=1 Tax=Compostibacillus humi TaxID=1245525 RepID=A0A8J2ZR52_9BACI|nr:hypothetical protein [Compostibacillus humi]GGH72714.1 hypothetical protein GCM10010978_09890 [Compostibacillus humi]
MRGFFAKKDGAFDDETMDGLVRAFVEIKRVDRTKRKVKMTITDCGTGKTVYKAEYYTAVKTDFAAYNNACDDAKQVIKRENYVLYGEIGTNVELPVIITASRRMR